MLKIIPLLLAALGVVSAAAYAAPELTVTNFGQSIESENVSGANDVDDLWLWNTVGLKYDDWTFGLTAGKQWAVDFDDHDGGYTKGVKSDDHRLQFDVAKPVTENFTLRGRYRGQETYDRFQLGYKYTFGMFTSEGDIFYDFVDTKGSPDVFHAELLPIAATFGPVKLAYYFEYVKNLGEVDPGDKEDYYDHQLRAYATLYKGEKLTLSTEGRFTIVSDETWEDKDGKATGYRHYDDFGKNRLYLKANYAVSENLDVYGSFGYEMREWKLENGKTDDKTEKYWSNVVIGYNYKF